MSRTALPRRRLAAAATALTCARLALAVPMGRAMSRPGPGPALPAAAMLAIAIATDVLDGRAARAAGTAGRRGQLLDHGTDCAFVTAALAGAASRAAVPGILPILVAGSFAQYAIDSHWLAPAGPLRGNRLGHYNGVLYFVPPLLDIASRLGPVPAAAAGACGRVLVVTTVASMGQRAVWLGRRHAARARRRPAGPARAAR